MKYGVNSNCNCNYKDRGKACTSNNKNKTSILIFKKKHQQLIEVVSSNHLSLQQKKEVLDTHFEWGLKIFLLWPLVDKGNEHETGHSYLSRS